jgi:glycosyltransferase involved in cell wall biosynthesis
MIQFSIIIPHHNIPNLLRRCLHSIPVRNDLEVIVVDDGSDKEYIDALHGLEKEFEHVTFIYNDTCQGGGAARNNGIEHSKGNYLMFADADDFYNFCLNDFLDDYTDETCDIIFFNANSEDTKTYLPLNRMAHLNQMHEEYEKNPEKALLQMKYLCGEPSNKLIKREIIEKNNIRFEETRIHNDTKFSYLVAFYSKECKVDHRAVYCLLDRKGSVSKSTNHESQLTRARIFAEKNQFLAKHNIPLFDNIMLWPFRHYITSNDSIRFFECLDVTKEYGFGLLFITKMLMKKYGILKSKAYKIPWLVIKKLLMTH